MLDGRFNIWRCLETSSSSQFGLTLCSPVYIGATRYYVCTSVLVYTKPNELSYATEHVHHHAAISYSFPHSLRWHSEFAMVGGWMENQNRPRRRKKWVELFWCWLKLHQNNKHFGQISLRCIEVWYFASVGRFEAGKSELRMLRLNRRCYSRVRRLGDRGWFRVSVRVRDWRTQHNT